MAGRAPYRCLWCKKRSFLVAPPNAADGAEAVAAITELDTTPLPEPVRSRREQKPEPLPLHVETGRLRHDNVDKVSESVTMMLEPEPAPAPARAEIRVPDAPPMYAEKGRLRLSGITLEQIQWRDSKIRRPKSSPRSGEESTA